MLSRRLLLELSMWEMLLERSMCERLLEPRSNVCMSRVTRRPPTFARFHGIPWSAYWGFSLCLFPQLFKVSHMVHVSM